MASLHRDPRGKSPFWYAAFTLPDGRRTFRSTKERVRNRAWEIALKWEKAAQLGRRGELTEVQARKVLNDILENAGVETMKRQSVEQFFMDWLASKEAAKAKGTARRYRDVIRSFLEQLGAQKRAGGLNSVTPTDVQKFRDSELRRGLANKTANFSLKLLRSVFNGARRQGLIFTNPAEAIDSLPDNSIERGVFTLDELRSLLREAVCGDADKAFERLDKAVAYQDPGVANIVTENLFDKIHSDPRWLPFLRKLGKAPDQLAKIEFKVPPLPQ